MQITQPAPESLRLVHTPWGTWLMSLVLCSITLGMLFWGGLGAVIDLDCRRVEVGVASCTVRRSQLFVTIFERSLPDVRAAQVERSSGGGRGGANYRVVLVGASGELPLASFASSGLNDKERIAEQVNELITGNGAAQLHTTQPDPLGLLLGGIWGVVGLFLSPFATGLRTTWHFDKLQRQYTRTQWRIGSVGREQLPLDHVQQVLLQQSSSSKGRATSRVALRLSNGRTVALTSYYTNVNTAAQRQAVDTINAFLGLSTAYAHPDFEALFQRGFEAYWSASRGDRSAAAQYFRQIVQRKPDHLDAWLYLADSSADPAERRDALQRVMALDPNGSRGQRAAATLATSAVPGSDGRAITGATTRLSAASFGPEPNVALPPVPGQVSHPLAELIPAALLLRPHAYRSIAHDPSLTSTAAALVLIVGLITGFFGGLFPAGSLAINGVAVQPGLPYALANMLVRAVSDLVGWYAGATICALVAAHYFRGLTSRDEMLRVFGFTALFKLFNLVSLFGMFAWVLSAIAVVIAVREAAEFDTGNAIATALISTLLASLLSGIVGTLLATLAFTLLLGGERGFQGQWPW